METEQTIIAQNKSGKIRLIKEDYISIQTRYIIENEKYFNSHKKFYSALAEYKDLTKGE